MPGHLAGLMLFLSGAAALIYQLGWVRLLGLGVGSTAVAVAAILAAFFGGLAVGSLFAQWRLRRGQDGLAGFAIAEGLIALSALLLLPLLSRPEWFLAIWAGAGSDSLWTFIVVFALLLVPTAAMGTTYPFLSAWLSGLGQESARTLSRLFAMNTLGAAGGVTLAGFWLIPNLGLDGAIYVAVALNLLAASLAGLLWRGRYRGRSVVVAVSVQDTPAPRSPILPVLALTGFTLMALEIVWSKYLGIYTGTTIHGFAAMMAIVLLGLVLGAALMHRWQGRHPPRLSQLIVLLLCLSLSLLLTRSLLALLPAILRDRLYLGELLLSAWLPVLMPTLLPSAMLFGAIFPLALALQCRDAEAVRHRLGLAYAVNTLAAIAGAVAASLWLIPRFGSDLTLIALALLPLAAVLWLLPGLASRRQRLAGQALAGLFLLLPLTLPGLDYRQLLSQNHYRFSSQQAPHHFRFLAEGRTGVVSLIDYGSGLVYLQRNGLNEAYIHSRDAYKGTLTESLLGALPYLLQDAPENAFVIGFGGGTTTRVLANSGLRQVHTVEIEPRVVEAMLQVGEEKFPFLFDGRVRLEFNDARVSLYATPERYSIIASQPSHPWLAGSANLYSREFFQLARSRLKADGIFAQWVNLFRMDAQTLRSILRTFYEVFPQGVVFGVMSSGDLILLGGEQTMVLDYERSRAYFENEAVTNTLRYGNLRHVAELPNYFLFTSNEARALAADAPLATDANLLVEVRLASAGLSLDADNDPYRLLGDYLQTDLSRYRRP